MEDLEENCNFESNSSGRSVTIKNNSKPEKKKKPVWNVRYQSDPMSLNPSGNSTTRMIDKGELQATQVYDNHMIEQREFNKMAYQSM